MALDTTPLTLEEYTELKDFILSITGWLPDNKATYTWNMFNRLRGESETMPCTCASSAGHWKRAVNYLMDWIKQKEAENV